MRRGVRGQRLGFSNYCFLLNQLRVWITMNPMFKPVTPQVSFPKLEEEVDKYWKKNKIFDLMTYFYIFSFGLRAQIPALHCIEFNCSPKPALWQKRLLMGQVRSQLSPLSSSAPQKALCLRAPEKVNYDPAQGSCLPRRCGVPTQKFLATGPRQNRLAAWYIRQDQAIERYVAQYVVPPPKW